MDGILVTGEGERAQGSGHSKSRGTAVWPCGFAEVPTESRAEQEETWSKEGERARTQMALKITLKSFVFTVDDDEVLKGGNELNFRKLTATKKEISKEK